MGVDIEENSTQREKRPAQQPSAYRLLCTANQLLTADLLEELTGDTDPLGQTMQLADCSVEKVPAGQGLQEA